MQEITLSGQDLASIGGAIVTLFSVAIWRVYKFEQGQVKHWQDLYSKARVTMQDEVKHWKDLHEDKSKELTAVLKRPDKAATDYIAIYKKTIAKQIDDLERTVLLLKSKLPDNEKMILFLTEQTKENEAKLVFEVEMREKLEQEIAAYDEFIGRFMTQSTLADQVIAAFSHGEFDVSKVEAEADRLQKKLKDIAATAYPRTRQNLRADLNRAAAQKAAAVQRALREKATARAQIRMKAAAPLPTTDDRENDRSARTGRAKAGRSQDGPGPR